MQADAPDCLVVGAGPAGLTTALYLLRLQRAVLVVDEGASRARWIDRTRNYPGFPDGISGEALLARMRRQLAEAGGGVRAGCVSALAADGEGFVAECGDRRVHARCVMLATGVVDRVPALPGIDTVRAAGRLRQCPICDGHEHRTRRVAVLGDGAHAAREALFLAELGAAVTRVALGEAPGPDARLAARLQALGVRQGSAPAASLRATERGVALGCGDGSAVEVDVVYVAAGVEPRARLAWPLGAEVDALGNLVVDARGRTGVPGLYAAGDVVSALDQLVVAAGQGAIAAAASPERRVRSAVCASAAGRGSPARGLAAQCGLPIPHTVSR